MKAAFLFPVPLFSAPERVQAGLLPLESIGLCCCSFLSVNMASAGCTSESREQKLLTGTFSEWGGFSAVTDAEGTFQEPEPPLCFPLRLISEQCSLSWFSLGPAHARRLVQILDCLLVPLLAASHRCSVLRALLYVDAFLWWGC